MTDGLRLHTQVLDYLIVAIYFAVVLLVGVMSRRRVRSSSDFLLAGRSLPAWMTGLAFLSANIGAVEILGQSANGAQYGMVATHYYWIGAIPAMVFLGLIMMPFYYGSKVRSVPEFLRLRFNRPTHLLQSVLFAVAAVLISGINLYALAILVRAMLGWPIWLSILLAGLLVLVYTGLGGLRAAVYNEVLQLLVIIAALVPLTVVGLHRVGGVDGLLAGVRGDPRLGEQALHAWMGTSLDNTTNPFGNWIAIVLGLGFVTSFGYWTTNFTEVQRALSAKDMDAARRTPLIAAVVKMFLPFVIILPGLVAAVLIPRIGTPGVAYNDALPALMNEVLPGGLIGLALAGLLAAFMAGMAANVSAFNTVVTYDIWQTYVRPGRPDHHYLVAGRRATTVGVLISIGTAFLAAGFSNIQDYIQTLQSFFNAPLFATFIMGMLFRRVTPWAGFWGLVAGIGGATLVFVARGAGWWEFASTQETAFYGAGLAFAADVLVTVGVTLVTRPKTDAELVGLVWSLSPRLARRGPRQAWVRSPWTLGVVVVVLCLGLSIWMG